MTGGPDGWLCVAPVPPADGEVVEALRDDVVVWRSHRGELCVMDARCPHQWSHLAAEGVVDGDEIVCTAHFWRFDTSGRGSKATVGGRRDEKSDIPVFESAERDGSVWARVTPGAAP